MELHVQSDSNKTEFISKGLVIDSLETEDPEILIDNIAQGCGTAVISAMEKFDTMDFNYKRLLDRFLHTAEDTVLTYIKKIQNQALDSRIDMIYDAWFNDYCLYDDEEDLIEAMKACNPMPQLIHNWEDDCVDFFLLSRDDSSDFREILGSVSVRDFRRDRYIAECIAYHHEAIANVLYDKVYGEENSPLRAESWVPFGEQLGAHMIVVDSIIEEAKGPKKAEPNRGQEALSRLGTLVSSLGMNPQIIKYWNQRQLCYSYLTAGGVIGSFDKIEHDPRYPEVVERFESAYGHRVYHAIECGSALVLLSVSANHTEWPQERLDGNRIMAYVYNFDDPDQSEFGDVVLSSLHGALVRIG